MWGFVGRVWSVGVCLRSKYEMGFVNFLYFNDARNKRLKNNVKDTRSVPVMVSLSTWGSCLPSSLTLVMNHKTIVYETCVVMWQVSKHLVYPDLVPNPTCLGDKYQTSSRKGVYTNDNFLCLGLVINNVSTVTRLWKYSGWCLTLIIQIQKWKEGLIK